MALPSSSLLQSSHQSAERAFASLPVLPAIDGGLERLDESDSG